MKCVCIFVLMLAVGCIVTAERRGKGEATLFTVATETTDGYARFTSSAKYYNVPVKTLGMDTKWQGGDMNFSGGGYKVNLFKEALKEYKDKDEIILFTDGYDVMFMATIDKVVEKFKKTGARILFSAENFCWPDKSLSESYPLVQGRGARFLNSGMFIGYARDMYEAFKATIKDKDDDQLFYTNVFLDPVLREKHKIQLDHKSAIFQNLNGAIGEIKLEFDPDNGEAYLFNSEFKTTPCIVHANGPSKLILNNFGNYLAGGYHNNECHTCKENLLEINDDKLPIVTLAIFAEKAMPFFEEFLDKISSLDYTKKYIHLFIHNNEEYHQDLINKYIKQFGDEYRSVKVITPSDKINERAGRNLAVSQSQLKKSDYLFVVDTEAHLDKSSVLKSLIRLNRSFVAPLIVRPGEVWSNFWGAISDQGYYARSHDYMDITNNVLRGVWNVPFVSSCYLIKRQIISKISYDGEEFDPDMTMCQKLRQQEIFMFITNEVEYGHLINGEYFDTKLPRPDFYMLQSNPSDWEQRYIHPEYVEHLNPNKTRMQPCTDVYWFPIVSKQFCEDLIAIMENFGRWSDGTNSDTRLQGGYEAVPTRDIHMNQVGLEVQWLKFLQLYVRPLQEAVFLGYFHNPPRSLMNFVVRYRPDEQPSLRPHHDSSTYTINIALNTVGVDYEGGGCHFLRYNCSVQATKMGWMLMHPGRLTHFHEGLKTTEGTRYIMISFVDP